MPGPRNDHRAVPLTFRLGFSSVINTADVLDGAGILITLWKIIIPLISPGIVSTGIICATLNYNEFLFAFFFTSNPTRILPIGVARKPRPEGPCPKGAGGLSPGFQPWELPSQSDAP
jgi:hypothetical protein